jgi:hypothetical protein
MLLKQGRILIVLVLEKENVERMQKQDPFDMHLADYPIPPTTARNLCLMITYEEDIKSLVEVQKSGDAVRLLQYLERNREVKPGEVHKPIKLFFQ